MLTRKLAVAEPASFGSFVYIPYSKAYSKPEVLKGCRYSSPGLMSMCEEEAAAREPRETAGVGKREGERQ